MKQLALLGPQIFDFCVKASRKLEASLLGALSSCFKTHLGQETAKQAMVIGHLPKVANMVMFSHAEWLLLVYKEPTAVYVPLY